MTDHFSESSGNLPNHAENFRTIPQASEFFGTIPHSTETFGTFLTRSERKEHHTLTVREVTRCFEDAGVPRTERSITNWCQSNAQGISRLDAFFDTNERKYFITLESVNWAIEEERSKQRANRRGMPFISKELPKRAEMDGVHNVSENVRERPAVESESKLRDLEITNRVKDQLIERLTKQLDAFDKERQNYVELLRNDGRQIGRLETQLFQLSVPNSAGTRIPPKSDSFKEPFAPKLEMFQNENRVEQGSQLL